jgi:hypothetical protein
VIIALLGRVFTCVLVVTDSTYVTENLVRAPRLKKNDWRNFDGQPRANHDLWDDLLKARAKAGMRVDFVWQQGKKSEIAKKVDRAAKDAAERGGIDLDRGYKPGSFSRSMVKGGVALPYPANGQTEVIRPYAKKIMHRGENRISFNCYDESTATYRAKFFAYTDIQMGAELHRGNGHRVQLNDKPKYPQIVVRIEGVELPKPPSKRRVSRKAKVKP